jgi:hypothetical protein
MTTNYFIIQVMAIQVQSIGKPILKKRVINFNAFFNQIMRHRIVRIG